MWWAAAVLLALGIRSRAKERALQKYSRLREFLKIRHGPSTLSTVQVLANTSNISSSHPVIQRVIERWKSGSTPGNRVDGCKVGLCIEGGGMRGCVAAGMVAAINYLGLHDVVDVVYGSSAGAMIGAYFISKQFSSVAIYHDILPLSGRKFLNKGLLLHSIGVPLFRTKTAVLDLDFLLDGVMAAIRPLEWESFCVNERAMALKIVATRCRDVSTVVFSRSGGHFESRESFLNCIRASMAVPGITGDLMAVSSSSSSSSSSSPFLYTAAHSRRLKHLMQAKNKDPSKQAHSIANEVDVIADAFISCPIPLGPASEECTHIIVLRTRPDPAPTLGKKAGIYENVIAPRALNKYGESQAADWIKAQMHTAVYARDLLLLNEGCGGTRVNVGEDKSVFLLPIAASASCREVSQLEGGRAALLCGMRDGATRVFELFLPAMGAPATAEDVAAFVQDILPDSILTRDFEVSEEERCTTVGM